MAPRVLVVDDESAVRKALEKALTRRGFDVLLASSGEHACEVLGAQTVDAVLMDLRMPTMSGQTLFHLILTQWPHLVSRVVVMSGDPDGADQHEWLRLYNLPVIPKPFDLAQVYAMLGVVTAGERRQVNG